MLITISTKPTARPTPAMILSCVTDCGVSSSMPAVYARSAGSVFHAAHHNTGTGLAPATMPGQRQRVYGTVFRVDTETLQTIIDTATDRELLVLMLKQLDHLDTQLHELRQFVDEHKPALDKAMQVLDNPVSKYLAARKAAK